MTFNPSDWFYILKDGLYECLKEVGAPRGPLSLKQIVAHLKSYILERQLFDPKDPKVVLCGNDKLGKVFGVEQFLDGEVKETEESGDSRPERRGGPQEGPDGRARRGDLLHPETAVHAARLLHTGLACV